MLASLIVVPATAEEVSEEIFTADFAYPDCTEEFSDRNGTQSLEALDDGMYITTTGFHTVNDATTYAGIPFARTYDRLNIKLKWKGSVTDSSGNIVKDISSENKFYFGLKTDTSNSYQSIVGMNSNSGFFRIGGNPATAYGNAEQPIPSGGFYNIEIEFFKNTETGYWWAYFYDLNDDRHRFFAERFDQFTDGATGFCFGSIRMGSEVSTRRIWTAAISDISITSGSSDIYRSALKGSHLLDTINVKEGKFDINQDADGVTLTTTDFVADGSKNDMMGFDFGAAYDDFQVDFRWKKGYITDSAGNVLSDLSRTVSSTYTLNMLSDNDSYIPLISMDYMGALTRSAGNAVTLYQIPKAAIVDNNDFYNLRLKFGKNASDGYWYSYFYDMNNAGEEIYRERYQGFTDGAKGITFGVSRMDSEVKEGTVWRTTLKNITVKSNVLPRSKIISDVSFTDGNGNPITIGYGADEVNVSLTVSDEIYGTYKLYIYLTGYNEDELKTVQRIPIQVSESDAGQTFTYTFEPCDNDMVKKVYLFDEKLMPFFDDLPSLYLINSAENGENVKYVYANTASSVTSIDYDNIQICDAEGNVCAEPLDVYYYPEDELVMIEVKAYEGCPERVKVFGLENGSVDGTAFQGYSETTYGTYIKGIRYDKESQNIYVQVINSSDDSKTGYITVFRRNLDGYLEEIAVREVGIDSNSNNQLVIPYSEDILGGFYAILQ